MNTTRIRSGFDVELQLGGNWFLTALTLLNDNGLLSPDFTVTISDVRVSSEEEWDLEIAIDELEEAIYARLELNEEGSELTVTTNNPFIEPAVIPFSLLDNLAGPPVLVKREGDSDHEDAIILLANMDIHAESQSGDPLPDGEFLARGNADDAVSFLPRGKDIALGMARATFSRFGNNIWHTSLRADNGSHPLPDAENKVGNWSRVSMEPENDRIRVTLEGDIPVDSPVIDLVPDPHVTITLLITPDLNEGSLSFSIETETDIDTGLLGDLFAAIGGGIIGFVIGLITGGLPGALVGAGVGAVSGVIVLELAEVVAEGVVQKRIRATLDGQPIRPVYCNHDGIVQEATQSGEGGDFDLSVIYAIPSSIPINTAFPEGESLYKESLLIRNMYDELKVDSNGFAVAGRSSAEIKNQPVAVSVASFNYEGDTLASITYERLDSGRQQTLDIEEVFSRVTEGELRAPFSLSSEPEDASLRIPEGKLACVCLTPEAIQQEDTIVTQIEFGNGLRLEVADAIALQDSAAIIVQGYQLIHPREYNAYYRARADESIENNFESLPKFE